jgi:Mrp family chromosome partitioning ATPase
VAAQLAAAAARCRAGGVLLVDANLARPAAHKVFALQGGPGLAEILLKGEPPAGVLQPSGLANLTVLAAGLPAGAPGRLAQALDALPGALQALQSDFELVVLDLPACSAGPLTARLAGQLDGVLLVIAAEGTRREAVQREKDLLAQANARLLGAVLNKWRRYTPGWLQRYL